MGSGFREAAAATQTKLCQWCKAANPAGLKAHALPEVMLAVIRGRNEEEAAAIGQLTKGRQQVGREKATSGARRRRELAAGQH